MNDDFYQDNGKEVAEEIGTMAAGTYFNLMLDVNNQGFMFSWNDRDINNPWVSNSLINLEFYDNFQELKNIAYTSFDNEYDRLKLGYNGQLPLRKFSDIEILSNSIKMATSSLFMLLQIDFYHEEKINHPENFDIEWKNLFVECYSLDDIKNLSNDKMKEIFKEKDISLNLQETITFHVDNFWKDFDVKSRLYSPS